MVLSAPKCNAMLLSTKHKHLQSMPSQSFTVKQVNNEIPVVDSSKILGVHFDKFMTWNEHLSHIYNQINKNLFLLRQIKAHLSLHLRKLFYNSYILPYLDYCCVIWGNCSKTSLDNLLKIQFCKRAARLILDVKDIRTSSHDMFSKLGWMPLPERIKYHQSLQVYKCLKGLCPPKLQNLFQYQHSIHGYQTRAAHKDNLFIPQKHHKSFCHTGASIWNELPLKIRNATSVQTFKRLYNNNL